MALSPPAGPIGEMTRGVKIEGEGIMKRKGAVVLRRGLSSVARTAVFFGLLVVVPGSMSSFATASCPNEQLRAEQGDQNLPDCRAYELVTPSDKGAASPIFAPGTEPQPAVAADGNHVWLFSKEADAGPNPSPEGINAVMSRTAAGWVFSSLRPSESAGDTSFWPNTFSTHLTTVGIETRVTKQVFVESPEHSFAVGPVGGPYRPIATLNAPVENNTQGSFLAGASEDGGKVVLASTDHTLAPGVDQTITGAHDLYEWSGHGECRLGTADCAPVNVTSAGSLISACGAELGRTAKGAHTNTGFTTPMSSDGSKIFFTAPDETMNDLEETVSEEPACKEPLRIYMRVDGVETVEVSAPQGIVDPTGYHDSYFLGATLDGTHVWFTSTTELTPEDEGVHDQELYEYNTVTRRLVRVSHGESAAVEGHVEEGGQNEHDIAFSEDGSVLYFKAQGKLTADTPREVSGQFFNIYRYDTATGAIQYVATTHTVGGAYIPLDASADGGALAFDGKEETTASNGVVYDEEPNQIFRYDAAEGKVNCVSCPPKGIAAIGEARSLLGEVTVNETFSNGLIDNYELSADGRYVAFTSKESLVLQDPTKEAGEKLGPASDVYEWEAPRTGACVGAEGCLSLISRPDTGKGSKFLGMGADGQDLLFATSSVLVPQDDDTVGDVYDARIDGGFWVSSAAACSGEGCRLIGSSTPTFGQPQSNAFVGAGNPVPTVVAKRKAGRLTRAQKLAKALKACRARPHKRRRKACELKARRRYGSKRAKHAHGKRRG